MGKGFSTGRVDGLQRLLSFLQPPGIWDGGQLLCFCSPQRTVPGITDVFIPLHQNAVKPRDGKRFAAAKGLMPESYAGPSKACTEQHHPLPQTGCVLCLGEHP